MASAYDPSKSGTIFAICGSHFALIAGNTSKNYHNKKKSANMGKIIKLTPYAVLGAIGSEPDVHEFSKIMSNMVSNYRFDHGKTITTDALRNVISIKLYERRDNPYNLSCVLAGLDDNGCGMVKLFDPIGFGVNGTSFCSTGSGEKKIDPIVRFYFKHHVKDVSLEEATDLTYRAFSSGEMTDDVIEVQTIQKEGIQVKEWIISDAGHDHY